MRVVSRCWVLLGHPLNYNPPHLVQGSRRTSGNRSATSKATSAVLASSSGTRPRRTCSCRPASTMWSVGAAASDNSLPQSFDIVCPVQVFIWDLNTGEAVRKYDMHSDTIFTMAWNKLGTHFCTTCKDKKLR